MSRTRAIVYAVIGIVVVLIAIGALVGNKGSGGSNAGQVIFGSSVDASAFTVSGQETTAKVSDSIGWVAYLTDSVNGTKVTLTVGAEASGGGEATVDTIDVDVANPQDNELAHTPDGSLGSLGAGTYTLRYVRPSDGTVLAQGTITLTP